MNLPPIGLLLPESILISEWFLVLATMVAFNTIVYLGLTLAKSTPWPRQFHPDRTRAWLARVGVKVGPPGRHRAIASDRGDVDEPLALSIVRREIPQAFGLMGGVVIIYALAGVVIAGSAQALLEVAEIGVGALLILASVILTHRRTNPRRLIWAWVSTCTALVALQVWDAYLLNNHLPIVYSLLIIVVMAPVALAWVPALIAGLLMVAIITAGGIVLVQGIEDFRITVLAMVCLVISMMLLRLRLSVVDVVTEERRRADSVAASDPMTGTLSRRGLVGLVQGMADNAERAGADIYVVMAKLLDLNDINRRYGGAYADTVLQILAGILNDRSRPGDLVGRWSGSRFLVVGMGASPAPAEFARAVDDGIRLSGIATGKRPLAVAFGVFAAAPADTSFERMVEAAESALQTEPKPEPRPKGTP